MIFFHQKANHIISLQKSVTHPLLSRQVYCVHILRAVCQEIHNYILLAFREVTFGSHSDFLLVHWTFIGRVFPSG